MRAIDADELIRRYGDFYTEEGTEEGIICSVKDLVDKIPTVEIERKTGRLSNKEWIDFLVEQFNISRTSAKDMLHVMMQVKREDNFKKQFSGAKMRVEHESD